ALAVVPQTRAVGRVAVAAAAVIGPTGASVPGLDSGRGHQPRTLLPGIRWERIGRITTPSVAGPWGGRTPRGSFGLRGSLHPFTRARHSRRPSAGAPRPAPGAGARVAPSGCT